VTVKLTSIEICVLNFHLKNIMQGYGDLKKILQGWNNKKII